ncbi:MAG: 6-carboxytetrahydropterin synthase [Oligoflexales bacterium]|nr:6-carboxytetrahydropterin synthase [Oligoflexales bacterium]
MNKKDDPRIRTLFIDDVDQIDCAIFDPSQGIIGQSWHVDVKVTGIPDDNGFVYDFGELKKLIKKVLKSTVDHSLLIPVLSTQIQYQETTSGELWKLKAKSPFIENDNDWEYRCPKGAVFPIRAINITKTLVERECTKLIRHRLPEYITDIQTTLRAEKAGPGASFIRYTHGISDHEGLCQRPFHGHRSLVEIYVNDIKRIDLEQYVTHEVLGPTVHIASKSQLSNKSEKSTYRNSKSSSKSQTVKLSFKGTLGKYQALIPKDKIFFVENMTTIESISHHILKIIEKREKTGSRIKITCYEGIGKGAIAEN